MQNSIISTIYRSLIVTVGSTIYCESKEALRGLAKFISWRESRGPEPTESNVYIRVNGGVGMEDLRGYECKSRSKSGYSEFLTTISFPALNSFS